MDLREKLEARKAELRIQLEQQQSEVESLNAKLRLELERQEAEENDAARKEAALRLARLDETSSSQDDDRVAQNEVPETPAPVIINQDTAPVQDDTLRAARISDKADAEIDAELAKRSATRWTSSEKGFGGALMLAALGAFFFSWVAGLAVIVILMIYTANTNSEHKRQLRAELEAIAKSAS